MAYGFEAFVGSTPQSKAPTLIVPFFLSSLPLNPF